MESCKVTMIKERERIRGLIVWANLYLQKKASQPMKKYLIKTIRPMHRKMMVNQALKKEQN